MNIELSIIIPYHNEAPWLLKRCLGSLLFIPDYIPCEILVIDDGSKNQEAVNWVESLQLPYVRIIHQGNKGPGGARNTGIDESQGEYITFVDADDFVLYGPFIELLKLLRDKKPDILGQKAQTAYEGSATQYMYNNRINNRCFSYIIRRSVLGDIRFMPGICYENEEFCTRLHLLRAHLLTVRYSAYHYNFHSDSIINSTNKSAMQRRFKDYTLVLRSLTDIQTNEPQRLALQKQVCWMALRYVKHLMRDTTSPAFTKKALSDLQAIGLYPLQHKWFGLEYMMTSILTRRPFAVVTLTPLYKLLKNIKDGASKNRAFTAYADINDAEDAELFGE